ncbi:MAG TPA: endonuclease/exonuclease/phosphatase family protein, partial [Anaeromyxobacteraceae bacterium]|nr:endonuclease/exonuclease/phosphatase family protein [Anaeromyxobacteraceae bacterium]
MRATLLLAILAGCTVPESSAPVRPAALRVATWNVHDLFDAEDRLASPGAEDDVPAPAEVEAKLERVAAVLRRLDADVVFLQEVENPPLLAALAARTGHPHHRLVEGADPRGIDVAALSRLPIEAYVSHLGERDEDGRPLWSRDCVEVHLGGLPRPVVLVGSHLVSRLSDDGTRRARQAAALRAIADDVARGDGDAVVIAGGDLNDEPGAPALAPLLEDGVWLDAAAALAPAGAWTWADRDRRVRLDYLLVPRTAAAAVLRAWILDGDDVAAAS